MRLFSQRKGLKPVKTVIQVDSMDSDLRNGLWNALTIFYWERATHVHMGEVYLSGDMKTLIRGLWGLYFSKPIDTIKSRWDDNLKAIREYFFRCQWNEVYDFTEFIANNYPDNSLNMKFMDFCNAILERELSGYRFVGGKITQITSEQEIAEIEKALEDTSALKPINSHLKQALDLLSDRKSPDYRNSIKESISAVEAICRLITGKPKATLGEALKQIQKEGKVEIHNALNKAFESLYGYTSDAEGIRHALLDEPKLDFEDAKFMLVSCSSFINYLISKSSKAGIKL